MRIAIDIDSTLHDHWPLVAAAAKRRFGAELPYPHAVETLNDWHDAGHSIHILSHRAERSLTATRRWLDAIGLRHHELKVVPGPGLETSTAAG